MPDTVIRVENLGKKYTIGHQQQGERYTALRDVITNGAKGIAGRFRGEKGKRQNSTSEDFWALKDVSFEIKQGDRVGIIGRNGAGKSTLLKILSRITEPTEGRIRIKGRVASLLEVGTGFHPELTGRENIYLNGAILGMGKVEIRRKFDEIVAFAEVERFLDTPVKRYSSGMYVRLAFAVAAHLEPEILVVDEVLAVGDVQFQKKCLGKMEEVGRDGRTVLFVSHNMTAIQSLCTKAISLSKGEVAGQGDISEQIYAYLNRIRSSILETSDKALQLSDHLILKKISANPQTLVSGKSINFSLRFFALKQTRLSDLALLIYSSTGIRVAVLDLRRRETHHIILPNSSYELDICISQLKLVEGDYRIGLFVANEDIRKQYLDLSEISVVSDSSSYTVPPYEKEHRGVLELDFRIRICEK